MTEGNDAFERNLERLIRAAAPPPPDAPRAGREFLARLDGTSHVRLGRMIAMAASLLAVAAILYASLAPRPPAKPETLVPQQPPPTAPSQARSEPAPVPDIVPAKPIRPEAAPGPASQPMVAKDGEITLSCRIPSLRALEPKMTLEGTAPLPDRTELAISVKRVRETCVNGKFVARGEPVENTSLSEVRAKSFPIEARWEGPGRYVATVALAGGQKVDVGPALRKVTWKSSTFEFDGWGDDLVGQLGARLGDLDALVLESLETVARLEKLAATESSWVKERKKINERVEEVILTKQAEEALKETERLLERLQSSPSRILLAMAHGEVVSMLGLLHGNAKNFHYVDGKMSGAKTYHGAIKTLRGDALDFETVKRYLGEVPAIGGRETALWIVKDLKRTRAQSRPALADALKTFGRHPGLAPVSDRLGRAELGDLDALEEEIRSGK